MTHPQQTEAMRVLEILKARHVEANDGGPVDPGYAILAKHIEALAQQAQAPTGSLEQQLANMTDDYLRLLREKQAGLWAAQAPTDQQIVAYRAMKTGALIDAAEVEKSWPTEHERVMARLAPLVFAQATQPEAQAQKCACDSSQWCAQYKRCHRATLGLPLAQPEAQAVDDAEIDRMCAAFDWDGYTDQNIARRAFAKAVLAAAPAPAAAVQDRPLTDARINAFGERHLWLSVKPGEGVYAFARAIERAALATQQPALSAEAKLPAEVATRARRLLKLVDEDQKERGVLDVSIAGAADRLERILPAPSAEAQETFWLIESVPYGGGPLYWTGALTVYEDLKLVLIPGVSADPNEAVRFTTQALAKKALDAMQHDHRIRIGRGIYKVAEHIWPAPTTPSTGGDK